LAFTLPSENCSFSYIFYSNKDLFKIYFRAYTRVGKFEEKHGNYQSCRRLFESALADLGKEALNEDFFISFIKFEIRMKEFDRCRALFKYGLENIQKDKNQKLYKFYVKFEKMHGSK